MNINSCKALIGLSLVASCGIALTPHPAAAQTTLPTITVIGNPPQSATEIQQLLDRVRPPSMIEEVLEYVGIVEEPVYPQEILNLSSTDCRLSQEVRTNAVAQELLSRSNGDLSSTYLTVGTEVTVSYANAGSFETFVVTPGSSGTPSNERTITPVAGSFVCIVDLNDL